MNCEKCQDLIGDFLDGALSHEDQTRLNSHLDECLGCADVRNDLQQIVSLCRAQRGDYTAPPNERALWLRIRNMIEAGEGATVIAPVRRNPWSTWVGRSWELSFGQIAAAAAAIVLIVSLSTVVGLRRWQTGDEFKAVSGSADPQLAGGNVRDRVSQQQQLISYWNQRVEFNKSRWNPQMRETFDRNIRVIDQAVNASFEALTQDPHDEVSEEMLNTALNEKLSLLKEFAAL